MSGLELTTGQKVQCGFVLGLLAISGFLIIRNTRPLIDGSVNAWTLPVRKHPVDKAKPLGPENPADPKKEETVSVFICAEGQLEITEYKNDPDRHPALVFKPELRRGIKVYKYYQDPMAPVAAITDPYRHTLALAAYTVANGKKSLGLLAPAALTADQLKAEADARTAMLNSLKLIQASVEVGTFHPDMMDKLLSAVAAYKARKGDPQADSVKADLARTVLEVAAVYMKQIETERDAEIDLYIAKIDTMLTAAQRDAVTKAGKPYLDQGGTHAVPAAGRGGRRGGAAAPNNGAKPAPQPAVPSRNSPARGARAAAPATQPVPAGGRGPATAPGH